MPSVDRLAVTSLSEALWQAREAGDRRPPFAVIAGCLDDLGVALPERRRRGVSLVQAREEWLRRLRSASRSDSTVAAYRIALGDLARWLDAHAEEADPFSEQTIVSYLADYRGRARPAPATYYRRFVLLRRFFRWLSSRAGVPDPFLELDPPGKPRQVADWLTGEEFARLLAAAAAPARAQGGMAQRDRLVLLALVATALRRSELIALDWGELDLEGPRPSLLVRCGKGGRPRRQPLAPGLARELAVLRAGTTPRPGDPVFRGLQGGRLQPTILAAIIRRSAARAELSKPVTAHTRRHTSATWLRRATDSIEIAGGRVAAP